MFCALFLILATFHNLQWDLRMCVSLSLDDTDSVNRLSNPLLSDPSAPAGAVCLYKLLTYVNKWVRGSAHSHHCLPPLLPELMQHGPTDLLQVFVGPLSMLFDLEGKVQVQYIFFYGNWTWVNSNRNVWALGTCLDWKTWVMFYLVGRNDHRKPWFFLSGISL